MVKGYLFISNGRESKKEELGSLEPIKTSSFSAPAIYAANFLGWKLYQGYNRTFADQIKNVDYDITYYNMNIFRNIFDWKANYKAYKNLCGFLETHPDIEIIHCNTPIGGVLGRICGHKYNKKVVYTAHGFHFYKGAPFVNRTIFKWVEQWMAHYTDLLITINHEDYEAAQKMHLKKGGKVVYVPGVGINTKLYDDVNVNPLQKKTDIGVPEDAHLCLGVGDLNDNKNVVTMVRAIAKTDSSVHLALCGFGPLENYLKQLCDELKVSDRVHFLGYRTDVKELYKASDFLFMASKREGLPRTTMEAMCAGVPCICSKIRGNTDLIDEGKGGYLVSPMDDEGFAEAIRKLLSDPEAAKSMGEYNRQKVKAFDIELVKEEMIKLYKEL